MDPVTLFLAIGLGIEALVCLYCAYRFRRWYVAKGQADPYLGRLKDRNTRVGLGAAAIAALIVYSLMRFALPGLDLAPLLPPIGSLLIGSALAWMMWGPISDWLTIRAESRE